MTGREKLLVGVMTLALVYAGYVFVLQDPMHHELVQNEDQGVDVAQIAQTALATVARSRLTDIEWAILTTNLDFEVRNPFRYLERPIEAEPETAEDARTLEEGLPMFVYQGFVEIFGQGLFVVINGREYQAGEQLALENKTYSGFYLSEAFTDFVIIERRNHDGTVIGSMAVELTGPSW